MQRMIKMFSELFGSGHHFYPGNMEIYKDIDEKLFPLDYSRDALEQVVLSQKSALETYDVSPTVLIFDKCVSQDDPAYRNVIYQNKEYRFTTVTIVSDTCEIDNRLLKAMDTIILCKDRNRNKMNSRCRSIWERKFSKKVSFDKFRSCVTKSVGPMKAIVLTFKGMHSMKFGKLDSSLADVCVYAVDVKE